MRVTVKGLNILFSGAALLFSAAGWAQVLAVHAGPSAADNPGALSSLDLSDGSFSVLGQITSQGGVSGIAHDGQNWFATLGGATPSLVTIDPTNGSIISTIGTVTLQGGGVCTIGDLAMGQDGILYGVTANGSNHVCDDQEAGTIVTINTSTAVAVALGRPMEVAYSATNVNGGLAVDGDNNLWLSPGWGHPDAGNLYIIDTTTGLVADTLSLSGNIATLNGGPNGLTWNPADGLLYATFEQYGIDKGLWSINPDTGESSLITSTADAFHDIAAPLPASRVPGIPVPALPLSGVILLLGAVLLTGLRKLRG